MTRKKSHPQRVDTEFEKDMKNVAKIRLAKGLARLNPKELSMSEMTRLLRRTDGYKTSLFELQTKPKRRDDGM